MLLSAALAAAAPPVAAQEPAREQPEVVVRDSLVEVRLVDGGGFIGRVVAVQGDSVTLETSGGARLQFTRAQIRSIRVARGRMVNGEFWREDPNRSRLFFSPTGRTIGRDEGYFGVYELFIPFLAYGATDNLLLAGGSPFYLAFLGEGIPPLYFGPKLRVSSTPKLDVSLGGMLLVVPEDEDGGVSGIGYGVGTYGSADNSLSFGLGWGFVQDELADRPVVMLGGETRVSRSIKLLTENVFVPGEAGALLSAGARFFGERLSADAGLVGFAEGGNFECCFPLVNFVYHFGGR